MIVSALTGLCRTLFTNWFPTCKKVSTFKILQSIRKCNLCGFERVCVCVCVCVCMCVCECVCVCVCVCECVHVSHILICM